MARQVVMPFMRGKIDADLRKRYDFFKSFGGGAVGYAAQSSYRLALAERLAEEEGWVAEWREEEESCEYRRFVEAELALEAATEKGLL